MRIHEDIISWPGSLCHKDSFRCQELVAWVCRFAYLLFHEKPLVKKSVMGVEKASPNGIVSGNQIVSVNELCRLLTFLVGEKQLNRVGGKWGGGGALRNSQKLMVRRLLTIIMFSTSVYIDWSLKRSPVSI